MNEGRDVLGRDGLFPYDDGHGRCSGERGGGEEEGGGTGNLGVGGAGEREERLKRCK